MEGKNKGFFVMHSFAVIEQKKGKKGVCTGKKQESYLWAALQT
jgi:hypothetical protein